MSVNISMTTGIFPIEKSSYFQFHLLEKKEIEKNQWYLGEKFGHPVDYRYAEWDWIWNYRANWIDSLKKSGIYPI